MGKNIFFQCGIMQLYLAGAAFLSSCEILSEDVNQNESESTVLDSFTKKKEVVPFVPEEIKYVITVHELYDIYTEETDTSEVRSFSGGTIRVITKPLISSKDMMAVEAQARPNHEGFCNLKVTLTPVGKEKWDQLYAKNNEKGFALLIDGEFYRTFRPRESSDDEDNFIVIDGPIDKVTANNIALYSQYNYTSIEKKQKENY